MDVTTVKLQKQTKSALDKLKSERESYDQVIGKLIAQTRNKDLREELVKGYNTIGKEELRVLNEWEATSSEL